MYRYLNTLTLFLVCIAIFTGCESKFTTVPLDSFEVGEHIQDGNEVTVIQFSGMESGKPPYKHLVHLLIVDQESQDTLNMLTLPGTALNAMAAPNKVWNFFSSTSSSLFEADDLFEHSFSQVSTVQCDKTFKSDLNNTYKTVLGVLGKSYTQ